MANGQLEIDWDLDALEAGVLHRLYRRVGRECAIQVDHLAADLQADPREVQHAVKRLREEHGAPILSTSGRPAGYYLPVSVGEIDRCLDELKRRAVSTMITRRALRRHRARLLGQQEIAA
jgi:hypothetical protein